MLSKTLPGKDIELNHEACACSLPPKPDIAKTEGIFIMGWRQESVNFSHLALHTLLHYNIHFGIYI